MPASRPTTSAAAVSDELSLRRASVWVRRTFVSAPAPSSTLGALRHSRAAAGDNAAPAASNSDRRTDFISGDDERVAALQHDVLLELPPAGHARVLERERSLRAVGPAPQDAHV